MSVTDEILHTSDFHFRKEWFEWLAKQASNFDACCLSGDLLDMLDFGTTQGMATQVRWVEKWAKGFPGQLYVCSGNHDWWVEEKGTNPMADGRWIQGLRRPGVWVDGDANAVAGYSILCQPWVGGLGQIYDAGVPSIVLAHAPPTGLPVSCNYEGGDIGDFETDGTLRELPAGSLVLSGHVHSPRHWHAERRGILCFNPGVSSHHEPNHIIIDTERHSATFFAYGCGESLCQWHSTA